MQASRGMLLCHSADGNAWHNWHGWQRTRPIGCNYLAAYTMSPSPTATSVVVISRVRREKRVARSIQGTQTSIAVIETGNQYLTAKRVIAGENCWYRIPINESGGRSSIGDQSREAASCFICGCLSSIL